MASGQWSVGALDSPVPAQYIERHQDRSDTGSPHLEVFLYSRVQPMTTHPDWKRVTFRAIGVVCLLATGLPACAQGPATVIPQPRKGAPADMHQRFLQRAKQGGVDLLFLGDSITQGWHDNDVWKRFYGPRNAANFGIGGDRTQHVLWRIQNGELDGIEPKVVVLMIGTNNADNATVDEIAQGVTTTVEELRHRLPRAKILLLGIFPRGEKPNPLREKLGAVNAKIAKLDDGSHVQYLDIGQAFLNEDGTISKEIMPDFLHLTRKGYRIWADAMEPTLWSMLDEPH
jgi:lysophospholipase L1-like esterase